MIRISSGWIRAHLHSAFMGLPRRKILYYIAVAVIIPVFFIILFAYGIYSRGWKGNFVYQLSRLLPYPAVLVDWEAIRVSAYLDDLRASKQYWATQKTNFSAEIKNTLIEKLIENKIVQIWAAQNKIVVNEREVADEWARISQNSRGEQEINEFLTRSYSWNEEQYKEKVLLPFLLRQKVILALSASQSLDEKALEDKANEIYNLARQPDADFADLARQYNQDKALAAGESGYFPVGTFAPDLEKKIFSMKIGEISGPIRSSFGYHIIKLEDLLYNDNGVPIQANIRQILFEFFDFDKWLTEQKQELAIYRLVK